MSIRLSRPRAFAGILGILAVGLVACAAPAVPAAGDPSPPLVAFYGDSYTLGTGASDPTLRWSSVIAEQRGWREFNPSVNGLGFINNRYAFGEGDLIDQIVQQDPDIVVVTMGLNDNFSYAVESETIREQISIDLRRIDDELPDARVIVVEPFWYTDERPASVEVIIGWVREAAAGIDADWIPGASRWLTGHPEWMAADRLHPNDDGYAEMATRMDAALVELGL